MICPGDIVIYDFARVAYQDRDMIGTSGIVRIPSNTPCLVISIMPGCRPPREFDLLLLTVVGLGWLPCTGIPTPPLSERLYDPGGTLRFGFGAYVARVQDHIDT